MRESSLGAEEPKVEVQTGQGQGVDLNLTLVEDR
jgi:hypothetical protein